MELLQNCKTAAGRSSRSGTENRPARRSRYDQQKVGKTRARWVVMTEYKDPGQIYRLEYPEGWLPLTHEGSPHVSLASLTTGGFLRIEACQFAKPSPDALRPERTLQALLDCEKRNWPQIGTPAWRTSHRQGMTLAWTQFTRVEPSDEKHRADFGHVRVWVFSRGHSQVRCLYRCRSDDAGIDDEELDAIIDSIAIRDGDHLDAASFTNYYYSVLKRRRPQVAPQPPEGLALRLADGQTVLLEHLYGHYRLEPEQMDNLIDRHISLLDYCGDDVPDLRDFERVKSRLFPKICRRPATALPAHRLKYWPGLAVGAVVRGDVFTYGVNTERLHAWGFQSLDDIMDVLLENMYGLPPVPPRGLRDKDGDTHAVSYLDRAFCASFILFQDFYQTTAQNLHTKNFLVGLPDVSCVSCFRDDDPRFVVHHTAMLRWDYHRNVDRLTDTIYLVSGPSVADVKPYDILHCCAKTA
jgi:hypothetical protein